MDGANDSKQTDHMATGRADRMLSFVRRRVVLPLFIICIAGIVLFTGGFIFFADRVTTLEPPDLTRAADGIVVLTGGYSRIEGALDLLKNKRGERLFISGVHPTTNRSQLQRVTGGDATLFECCVDIDRSAMDTVGNAAESVKWAHSNRYKRVIVVTNNYHIPRTMVELRRVSQDIEFIPYPIINTNLRDGDWITRGMVLRVLLVEYIKYIGAEIRSRLPASFAGLAGSVRNSLPSF